MAKGKVEAIETLKELTRKLNTAVTASRTAVSLARIAETFPDTMTPQALQKACKELKVLVTDAAATAEQLK